MLPLRKVEVRRLFAREAARHPPGCRLCFLLQSLEDPLNVGSLFRIADGCGADELILTGTTPVPPDTIIDRTSRGHDRRVPWRHIPHVDVACKTLSSEGWHLVALETARGALPCYEYRYPERVCLVLGNESKGVYAATLSRCHGAVFIPMYGKGPSLNVHVAAAVVAYQALWGGSHG